MGLLTFGIGIVALAILFVALAVAKGRQIAALPPLQAKPDEGLARIYFDGKKHWYDPMQAIINELPKLDPAIGRWELYLDSEAGKDILVLNWLDQLTGEVVKVSRVDLTDSGYHSSWRSLDGCGRSFQHDKVRSIVVMPVLKHVDYEFKYGKLKGAIKPEPRSYTII